MAALPVPIDKPKGIPLADPANPFQDYLRVFVTHVFDLFPDNKHAPGRVSGLDQLGALLYIASQTIGKPRKPKTPAPLYACITSRALAKALGCAPRNAAEVLGDLVKRGLVAVLTPAQARAAGLPPASHANARWYRLAAENWATAPAYEPKFSKLAADDDAADDDAADDDAADDDAADVTLFPAASPVTVLSPGQKTRPVAGESREFRVCSKLSVPAVVEAQLKSGLLTILLSDPPSVAGRTKSEPTMKCRPVADLRRSPKPDAKPDALAAELERLSIPCDAVMAARLRRDAQCDLGYFTSRVAARAQREGRKGRTVATALLPTLLSDANERWPTDRAAWRARIAQRKKEETALAEMARNQRTKEAEWRAACPEGAALWDAAVEAGNDAATFEAMFQHRLNCAPCRSLQ